MRSWLVIGALLTGVTGASAQWDDPAREPDDDPPAYGRDVGPPRYERGYAPPHHHHADRPPPARWDDGPPPRPRCFYRPGPWGPEQVCRPRW